VPQNAKTAKKLFQNTIARENPHGSAVGVLSDLKPL
jgi:hypothetical protein